MKMLANHLVNKSTNKLYLNAVIEKIVSNPIYTLVRPIIWTSVWNLIGVSLWVLDYNSVKESKNENA